MHILDFLRENEVKKIEFELVFCFAPTESTSDIDNLFLRGE